MTSSADMHVEAELTAGGGCPLVSVVIPVVHDDVALTSVLSSLEADDRVQVIVVDGGSIPSASPALEAVHRHVVFLMSAPGRARQMNLGAALARGEWVLFLHADTQLPHGWVDEVARVHEDGSMVGGCFRFRLDSDVVFARLLEWGVTLRVRWAKLPYGDQALFVRRRVFEDLGGFLEMSLMEDVDFIRRLRRSGGLHYSNLPAVTSARRWQEDGWLRRSAENVALLLLYLVGVSPRRLARWYRRGRAMPRSARSSNAALG